MCRYVTGHSFLQQLKFIDIMLVVSPSKGIILCNVWVRSLLARPNKMLLII